MGGIISKGKDKPPQRNQSKQPQAQSQTTHAQPSAQHNHQPQPKLITKLELAELLLQLYPDENVTSATSSPQLLLLDVRDPSEFNSTTLPAIHTSAKNIPLNSIQHAFEHFTEEEFEKQFGWKKPDKTDSIICYCRGGNRAGRAVAILEQLGYKNVQLYKGSASEWWK